MPKTFFSSTKMAVRFISAYAGVADYGAYVRRLNRDVRVHRTQATGELTCTSHDATAEERAACIAAVTELLAAEAIEFAAWEERERAATVRAEIERNL